MEMNAMLCIERCDFLWIDVKFEFIYNFLLFEGTILCIPVFHCVTRLASNILYETIEVMTGG